MVGLGGEVLAELRPRDRPRGHSTVDAIAGDLARSPVTVRRDCRERALGRHRRRGRRRRATARRHRVRGPEPGLARRAARASASPTRSAWTCPVTFANDADLGALAELRRGRPRGARRRAVRDPGRGRRRRRPDRRWAAHGRRGRLCRRGRAHAGQPRGPRVPLRLARLLGDRDRRARAAAAAGSTPTVDARPSKRSSPRPQAGDPAALDAMRPDRSLARDRARRAGQRAQPEAHRAGRPARPAHPFVERRVRGQTSSVRPARATRSSSGSCPRCSERALRCWAPASLRSNHC